MIIEVVKLKHVYFLKLLRQALFADDFCSENCFILGDQKQLSSNKYKFCLFYLMHFN